MHSLEDLLREKLERYNYATRVIAALMLRYEIVDKSQMVAREAATAGHVHSYLSCVLGEVNSWKFQQKIKSILVENDIIKPTSHGGIMWWKGLVGLEEDLVLAHHIIEQHYKDREAYRKRQRENAKKRWQ